MSQKPNGDVLIIDGARTPFLKARGAPGPFAAADLAVQAGRGLLARLPFEPDAIDQVLLGCVAPGPDEANIARIAALRLGCGERTPAWTVQRNCASGLQAIDSAAMEIRSGRSELVLAGGSEAMSHAPVLFSQAFVRWLAGWGRAKSPGARLQALTRFRPAHLVPVVGLLRGLTDPVVGLSMGQTAEELAYGFGITREQMDRFALDSHERLGQARDAGRLQGEIVPLVSPSGEIHEQDDGWRGDGDLDKLAGLKAVFDRPEGKVTAGNSAQVSDGAAWLLLASERAAKRWGLQPLARIRDSHWAALPPDVMGLGPVHASEPLLRRNGLGVDDLDAIELNEAFAAQVLACRAAWSDPDYLARELGAEARAAEIPTDKLNADGGAIAIGHPVGASGARLVLHLAKTLRQDGRHLGLATLCIGGGQGGAMLIESGIR